MVGAHGFEPWTSSLSEMRSNQLSYAPVLAFSDFVVLLSCPLGAEQCNAAMPGLASDSFITEGREPDSLKRR